MRKYQGQWLSSYERKRRGVLLLLQRVVLRSYASSGSDRGLFYVFLGHDEFRNDAGAGACGRMLWTSVGDDGDE
nr:hypothetical protein CFP56_28567 [Quercus suber]